MAADAHLPDREQHHLRRSTLVIVALALAGCGPQAVGASSGDVLLSTLPSPLPQTVATSQELTTPADVAAATPADPATVTRMLSSSSFQGANVRVWTAPNGDYVTIAAVRFGSAADAVRLVQVETGDLEQGTNTFVTPHAALSGSYVFVIHGTTRSGSTSVVCEGVWAPVRDYAVETLTCSATGAWADQAEALAQQESALIAGQSP